MLSQPSHNEYMFIPFVKAIAIILFFRSLLEFGTYVCISSFLNDMPLTCCIPANQTSLYMV